MRRLVALMTLTVGAGTAYVAAPAHAAPVCAGVQVTGVVNVGPPELCPLDPPFGNTCNSGHDGLSPWVVVYHEECVPKPVGA